MLSNNVGGSRSVFKCPKDNLRYFENEGSSFEWNYTFNGQPIESPKVWVFDIPTTKGVRPRATGL